MEILEDHIKIFLNHSCSCYDFGHDSGINHGDWSGYGYEAYFGSGQGFGSGSGNRSCSGCGWGSGLGSGDGKGRGYGDNSITNSGYGSGYSRYIKEINGETVYIVDGVQTIIKSVHNNIAQGFILQNDLILEPCYIVKEQSKFAHGITLHDAFNALQEKLYDDSTEEERIEAFHKKFPEYDTPYSNRDLFTYHHILTGSCHMGRESFCKDMGIDLNGNTTVREFVSLTKNSYGSNIICNLPKVYGINNFNN